MKKSFLFVLFLIACSTQPSTTPAVSEAASAANDTKAVVVTGKLSTWSCDVLIEKTKQDDFALKGLASLVAKKRCPDYKFDMKTLSDLEKRFYQEQIDELDPNVPAPTASLSIDDLKQRLKIAKSPADKLRAYKQLRGKQKNNGKRTDFIKTTRDMHQWAKKELQKKKTAESQAHFYEAAQLTSRAYWTEDKMSQAHNILSEALEILKDSSVAEIYYIQARMAEEKIDMEKAVLLYDKAANDVKEFKPRATSFTVDKILWLKSWILLKEKKWSEAEKSFQSLADSTIDISERSRALFYRARCLSKLEKKDEAKAVLEAITESDFFGYYGLVAFHELGRKMPALSKVKFEKKFPFDLDLSFLKLQEKLIFQELIKYQELDIAEKSVIFLSRSPEYQINLGIYLADKGSRYLPLFAGFGKLDNNSRIEVLVTYGQFLYPQPHQSQVKTMAEKTAIPQALIYSIMKQESAFNEKTRSAADAMGLMQMIPRLAKQLSKKFSVMYTTPEDLYNPDINIQLGSFELMEQIKKQAGQLTFVAAAYNAGPGALSGWLKTRNRSDILEFIEEIPYEETRTYVKLIARNKLFYDRISKRDDEHSFPAEFLNWDDSKKDTSAKN